MNGAFCVSAHTHFGFVIPIAVQRARVLISARVGWRDLAFELLPKNLTTDNTDYTEAARAALANPLRNVWHSRPPDEAETKILLSCQAVASMPEGRGVLLST